MSDIIAVVDTETTDYEGGVVEIGAVIEQDDEVTEHSDLCSTEHRISFQAMAVHHITEEMVKGKPPVRETDTYAMVEVADYLVAHNAEFDSGFLPDLRSPWICTWRLASHMVPDAESHSNMALRYELGLTVDYEGEHHRAGFDAHVTYKLFKYLRSLYVDEFGWSSDIHDKLVKYSAAPILQKKVKFGKHRGELWEEVPRSYLRWAKNQEFDADTMHTINYFLD